MRNDTYSLIVSYSCLSISRFNNGGILFSSIFLVAIATISLFSFLLLVESRQVVPASFGDIGGHLYGPYMRLAVLLAIAISQIGFVCAYMSFVATNLEALAKNVISSTDMYPSYFFVLIQLIVFIPLALVGYPRLLQNVLDACCCFPICSNCIPPPPPPLDSQHCTSFLHCGYC